MSQTLVIKRIFPARPNINDLNAAEEKTLIPAYESGMPIPVSKGGYFPDKMTGPIDYEGAKYAFEDQSVLKELINERKAIHGEMTETTAKLRKPVNISKKITLQDQPALNIMDVNKVQLADVDFREQIELLGGVELTMDDVKTDPRLLKALKEMKITVPLSKKKVFEKRFSNDDEPIEIQESIRESINLLGGSTSDDLSKVLQRIKIKPRELDIVQDKFSTDSVRLKQESVAGERFLRNIFNTAFQ